MRPVLAVLAAAAVGALGAVILGEYNFEGVTILASGVVFGLFIAEAALAVNRKPALALGAASGVIGLAAMVWGGWITTFHHLSLLPVAGWVAVVLCGLSAGLRAGVSLTARKSRRGSGTPDPAPAPAASPEDRTPS